jgi:hypothetical protein
MLFFPKLNNRNCGKMLAVTLVPNCETENPTIAQQLSTERCRSQIFGKSFPILCLLFALLLKGEPK